MIEKVIKNRFSPKDFNPEVEIPNEHVQLLFAAAQGAPSCFNEQPWSFHYALRQNKDGFERIYKLIMDGNKPWSGDASMLILGWANGQFARNGKPNAHGGYDLGQAVQSLVLQAHDLGYHAHQMAGFYADKAQQEFQMEDHIRPMVIISIGKRKGDDLPERKRKSNSDIFCELL